MTERTILIFSLVFFMLFPTTALGDINPWAESYRLEALSQYETATKSIDAVIERKPQHEFAYLRRGWLNYLAGKHNTSIRDYQKAMDLSPKSLEARLGIMLPLIAQQRWREVNSHANKVLEVAPWNYYAHVRLMIAEEGERKWDTLLKHATAVNQRYPSDATVLLYLARANAWQNNDKAARNAYQQVLERSPSHIEALQYLSQ